MTQYFIRLHDGADRKQMWGVGANIFNKQWHSQKGVTLNIWCWMTKKPKCSTILLRDLELNGFVGMI
jgi:hypothetical protein